MALMALGCCHTAGVCDCDLGHHDYHPGVDPYVAAGGHPATGQSAPRLMPQATSSSVDGIRIPETVSTPSAE
jgi:hypothetical protein